MVIVIFVIGYKCRKRSSNRNQNPQQNLAAPSNIHINHPRTFQMHGDGNIPTRPAENNTSPPSYEKVLLDSGGDTQMVYKVNEQGIGQYVTVTLSVYFLYLGHKFRAHVLESMTVQ